ncbi:hypothetical protein [Hymenobacter gelipurpurascens]|uniref:hypothetical protein n=1 Tax=Hymenobacter gelipurpurascens TaxID=89968 RepID=UPI001BAECFA9|nr:hypothetical protein [Hymenobacter gelipurpurascens]
MHTDTKTTFQYYRAPLEDIVNVEIRPQVAAKLERILADEGVAVLKGPAKTNANLLFRSGLASYLEVITAQSKASWSWHR